MIRIEPLTQLDATDIAAITTSYVSEGKYVVEYEDTGSHTSIALHYVTLPEPLVRQYNHFDAETLQHHTHVLQAGFSFGAYDEERLVGLLIAESRTWNETLWVWEFHVAAKHRRTGIGRQLMACVEQKAKRSGLRSIVCETQNTNATAILAYRRLGFSVEGVDISYYSNQDYPDGDVAVFMKRRLTEQG